MSDPRTTHLFQSALQAHRQGRWLEAARGYAEVRRRQPQHFDALHLGGTLCLQLNQPAEGLALLQAAARLRPQDRTCSLRLALAENACGRHEAAEARLRELTRLDPSHAEAWSNLGTLLTTAGRLDEARIAYERALAAAPRYAQAWTALGSVLLLQGQAAAAIAHHTRALQEDPRHPTARFARGQAYVSGQRLEEAQADFEAQLARQPTHFEARSNRLYLLNYRDDLDREALWTAHREYGRIVAAHVRPAAPVPRPATTPAARLRVAFLSPDLRTHAVSHFIEPLLAHLDPEQFEIGLYHDHVLVDAVSERLRGYASPWRHVARLPDDALAAQIRADAPDVLVDLAGHTGCNRLPLLARRLAPVQVNYLGYPHSTGLDAMDFRLVDAITDPPGEADRFHTERLVRFAPTAWAYQPPPDAPEIPPAGGRPVIFGSFNNAAKLSPSTLRLWARLLAAVPASRLALKSLSLDVELLRARCVAAGIEPARLLFLPAASRLAEHLATYAQIDIALDPFPYNGTTTTCEALWMGRPVVTLLGNRHAARVGASLLTAIGHSEWIARDPEDYLRIAVDLATQPARLTQESRALRAAVQASPLGDHAGQARRFGAALLACAGRRTGFNEPVALRPTPGCQPSSAMPPPEACLVP